MKKNSGRGSFEGATPSEFNSGYDFGGQWSPSELELARRQARKKKNQRSALIAALSSFLVLGTLVIVIIITSLESSFISTDLFKTRITHLNV